MAHYFDEKQNSELNLSKFEAILRGKRFGFFSGSGIFSKDKVDRGTRILAENMIIHPDDAVLDIGCGIGILGITAAGITKNKVIMCDINKRAVDLAEKNIKLNNALNAEVLQGNLYEPINEKFDVIVSNPPMKAGCNICFGIIEKAKKFLSEGGSLQIVAMHNKGGRRLSEKMKEVFGNVEAVVKESGFRVYLSKTAKK